MITSAMTSFSMLLLTLLLMLHGVSAQVIQVLHPSACAAFVSSLELPRAAFAAVSVSASQARGSAAILSPTPRCAACCLLPAACYLLPADACCVLRAAYCVLVAALLPCCCPAACCWLPATIRGMRLALARSNPQSRADAVDAAAVPDAFRGGRAHGGAGADRGRFDWGVLPYGPADAAALSDGGQGQGPLETL